MKADFVLLSSNIFTSCNEKMINGGIAISNDTIVAIGSMEEILNYIDEDTQVYDFQDQMVIPGFIDAHIHYLVSALWKKGRILFIDGESEKECVEIARELSKDVNKDQWIITQGWYLPKWKSSVLPTKDSLDEVFGDQPVCMQSADGHTLWINSEGLRRLKLNKDSIPPKGGGYERGEAGELTGILYETAALAATGIIMEFEKEILKEAFINFQSHMAMHGVTAICDMSMMSTEGEDQIKDELYKELFNEGKLKTRLNLYPTITKNLSRPLKMQGTYKDDILRFGGVKQFFDGVSSTHTAYLREPYSNSYFEGDCGTTTLELEEMKKIIFSAVERNMQIRIHTIGDMAIHKALDYFQEAYEKYGFPKHKNTLEHLEEIYEEDIERLKALNIVASVQPGHVLLDMDSVENDMGKERIKHMWAFREMFDGGVTLAFGTDSPIIDTIPMLTIYYAVTRKNLEGYPDGGWQPHQKVSVEEAIIAHTYGSASACGMENMIGTLEVGKKADIVVLQSDITKLEEKYIPDVEVVMTMMNGKIVYFK